MATQSWLGAAVPIPEQQAITLTGTWAQGDTLALAINGKTLTLTAGTTVTLTQVALDAVDMINGATANSDEVRSALGTSVGEWIGLTASSAVGVITILGASDGKPIGTITATATTAGDGAAAQAVTIAADGPKNVNNADNWSAGSVPGAADDIIFDHSAAADCKYALGQLAAVAPSSITVTRGFRYQLGLPETNQDNASHPYDEPNETYFQVVSCADVKVESTGSKLIKIDTQSAESHVVVNGTGTTVESGTPSLLVKANHASSTITVRAGSVGLCQEPKTTGQIATAYVSGGSLEIGDSTTVATLSLASGLVVSHSAITTVNIASGTFEHRNGNITTLTIDAGICYPMTDGTYTTVYHNGGVIDCTKDVRSRTFDNYNIYPGSTLKDPLNTVSFTNDMDVHGKLSGVTLDQSPRKTYSISDI